MCEIRSHRLLHGWASPRSSRLQPFLWTRAVSYYGGGIAPGPRGPGLLGRLADVKCPLLFFWGGLDTHIGADTIRAVEDALIKAKKDYTNVVMGKPITVSSATSGIVFGGCFGSAWPMTLAFLKLNLGG